MLRSSFATLVVALLLLPASGTTPAAAQATVDGSLFSSLHYRNIGPFRGGRVTTVTGIPGQPFTYYMGATGGGVWKTTDAGTTWKNISDGYFNTTGDRCHHGGPVRPEHRLRRNGRIPCTGREDIPR